MLNQTLESAGRILVVDDEARMVDSLKTLLSMEGYHVSGAYHPTEALEMLEKTQFDLVITDIKMPDLDGIEILRKAHEIDPLMGVILITGYASLESAKHAIEKGAFGYLTKPLELDELKLIVAQSIEKRKIELERLDLLNELRVANETLELKLAQINALSSAGNLLATTIDLKEALTSILSLAIDVIGAKLGSVMILDPENEELFIAASCGLSDEIVQNTRLKVGISIAGYVAQTRKPLMVEDIEQDPRFGRMNRERYESNSLISVPLLYKDELFGVINLNNKLNGRPFNEDDMMMLASLAIPAAVAIDRANLIAQKTETIDELRVLHNLAEKVSMLDDPQKIAVTTYEGLKGLLRLSYLFWYDHIELHQTLQLEFHCGDIELPEIPTNLRDIDVSAEQLPNSAYTPAQYIERIVNDVFQSSDLIDKDQCQIVTIPIYLRRALGGVAVLVLPRQIGFKPALRELAILALSQTAAIYQRQKAVLNATQLVTMGKLLGEIGHDLKKPLTNLKGSIQVYKEKIKSKIVGEYFKDAEKEVGRMAELVKEMVEFANPNMYLTKKMDIRRVLERSLSLLNSDFEKKSIMLSINYAPDTPPVMLNDREMLQVFVNIALNAVDSMDDGGSLNVSARLFNDNGKEWVRIVFQDTGCGIPEENLHRIFDRYYTTKQTGTGLGLAIVERIVSVHNGRINVDSKVNSGTKFIIDLPV